MRPYLLAETNWKSVRETDYDFAILPWGATEAHNYHLPYATDNIEADHIAAESARLAWEAGVKPIVLPTIPFGVNTGQADIKLDINLNPSTQLAILHDIITVLDRQGIRKLFVLNSHGGNDFKTALRELGLRFPRMLLTTGSWFRMLDKTQYFDHPDGDHAEEMETSLILHFRPELVQPLAEAGDGAERPSRLQAIREGWVWAERRWSQISADTGVGDPRSATAEKGARYFKDVTEKLAAFYVEFARCDIDDLYQD